MPVRIYVHASWTTFARLPLIDQDLAVFLDRFVRMEANRQGAKVIEVGIVRDHLHVVLELPATFDVPRLMQGLKGASARIANRRWDQSVLEDATRAEPGLQSTGNEGRSHRQRSVP